jgi:hypothetical protein
MEGFDELRVKKALALPRGEEINMIIAVGKGTEADIREPRVPVPNEEEIKVHPSHRSHFQYRGLKNPDIF